MTIRQEARKTVGLALLLGGLALAGLTAPSSASEVPEVKQVPSDEMPKNEKVAQALHLGDQYRSSSLPDKAAEEYEKALQLDPEYKPTYVRLGYALLEAEQFEKAVKIYQRYVDLAPKECASHSSLGFAYLKQGLTDQAIASYEKALELCPEDANSYMDLGKVYAQSKYDLEAAEAFRHAVELNPDLMFGYESLARIYSDRKLYPEAIAAYEALLNHPKINDPQEGKPPSWQAWAHSRVATMYNWAGADEKAIPHYKAVLASAQADEESRTRAIRGLAQAYEKSNQTALAIELYEDLTKQVSDQPAYFYRLGELLNDVGRHQDAIATAKKGQEVDPECAAHAYCVIGFAYEKLGGLANIKRAEREFEKASRCGDARFTDYARKQVERQRQLIRIEELKQQKSAAEGD